jgi:hypothetical protein
MAQKVLLRPDEEFGLTEAEQMALTSMTTHPGFPVLEKMFMAACKITNDAVIQLDPSDEAYDRLVKPLQQKARERNEFSLMILRSIAWHEAVLKDTIESKKPQEASQNIILTKGNFNV